MDMEGLYNDPKKYNEIRNELRSYEDMMTRVTAVMKDIELDERIIKDFETKEEIQDAMEAYQMAASTGDQNLMLEATYKFLDEDRVLELAGQVKKTSNIFQSEEEIANTMRALMPTQIDLETKVLKKLKPKKSKSKDGNNKPNQVENIAHFSSL